MAEVGGETRSDSCEGARQGICEGLREEAIERGLDAGNILGAMVAYESLLREGLDQGRGHAMRELSVRLSERLAAKLAKTGDEPGGRATR